MSNSKDRSRLDSDLRRLRRLLGAALTPATAPSLTGKSELSVLNVACGACDEAGILSEVLGTLGGGGGSPARTVLVGTDLRAREVAAARARFRSSAQREFEFFQGDASRLRGHRQLREVFDLVFLRHQNLYNGRQVWRRIFEQALDRLNNDGLLVITSYFEREHALALAAFADAGAEVVATVANPNGRALPTPGKSVDRHLAVLRKARPRAS